MEEKFLDCRIIKLEIELTNKTFETVFSIKLGGIEVLQYFKKKTFFFVSTKALIHDFYLFVVEYINVSYKYTIVFPTARSSYAFMHWLLHCWNKISLKIFVIYILGLMVNNLVIVFNFLRDSDWTILNLIKFKCTDYLNIFFSNWEINNY